MIVKVIANKALKEGKYKIITDQGDFYHTSAIPVEVADIRYEEVPKDGKVFNRVLGYEIPMPVGVQGAALTPSLPKTSLPDTPAPGGEEVVKKTGKASLAKVTTGDPDRMSKADWATKDRNIELVAIVKSTIESPAYQELIMGKNVEQACEVFDALVSHFLTKFDELKGR